jgi:hypothetical protein
MQKGVQLCKESASDGHDPVSFSLPFRDGAPRTRLGELAIADGEV